jgi:hypothetical protein
MRHAIKKILGYILDNIIINMWYKFHQNRFSRSRDILSTSLKKVGSFEKNAREKKSTTLAYIKCKCLKYFKNVFCMFKRLKYS